MKDYLRRKMTFGGRRPLTEDHIRQKTTFDGRLPLSEYDLWRMMAFDGRRPSIRYEVYYLKNMFTTPHLDSHSTTDPKPEILSAVLTGNRISHDQRNVRGIMHVHVCRKYDIFRQTRLNDSEVGGEIAFRRVYPARAYSTVHQNTIIFSSIWNRFFWNRINILCSLEFCRGLWQ